MRPLLATATGQAPPEAGSSAVNAPALLLMALLAPELSSG